MNTLYYGDNLKILKDKNYIKDESIDLIYLDPPFNSKADYNILYREPTGEPSAAQITAFEDTWHWTQETEETYQEIMNTAPSEVVEMMKAFRQFIRRNDMLAYLTMMCIRLIELKRVLKPTGSIYLHCDPKASHYLKIIMDTIFGSKNFRNEIVWCYKDPSGKTEKYFRRKHDTILFYTKSDNYFFYADEIRVPYSEGTQKQIEKGIISFGRRSKGHPLGKIPEDFWLIPIINSQAKERLGYPTQKPEALLERIIKASSKEGDVVLDPFCGCGTTIAVAQRLKRKWIGIDITHLAINLIKWRLKHMFNLEPKRNYKIIGEPEDLTGARELAKLNRYQFQWWALSLINARPYGNKRKGPDTGIDGVIYFPISATDFKKIIVSVKSGKVSVKDIRDLVGVLKREDAEIGLFITLQEPTREMVTEAAKQGFYQHPVSNRQYPRMQILTIESLLNGIKPEIPQEIPHIKKATSRIENKELGF